MELYRESTMCDFTVASGFGLLKPAANDEPAPICLLVRMPAGEFSGQPLFSETTGPDNAYVGVQFVTDPPMNGAHICGYADGGFAGHRVANRNRFVDVGKSNQGSAGPKPSDARVN